MVSMLPSTRKTGILWKRVSMRQLADFFQTREDIEGAKGAPTNKI